jgi:hypothetical protein
MYTTPPCLFPANVKDLSTSSEQFAFRAARGVSKVGRTPWSAADALVGPLHVGKIFDSRERPAEGRKLDTDYD